MSTMSIKEAVKTAKEKLNEIYEDDSPTALALEEIELIEENDKKVWSITFGFHRNKSIKQISSGAINDILKPQQQIENRVYKTVVIDAHTGDFLRMDMRLV